MPTMRVCLADYVAPAAAVLRSCVPDGTPVERPCPGDLAVNIARCPYITLEIEMPRIAAESTPAARMEFASSLRSESDPDCLNGDPRSITPAIWECHAKHRSSRRRLVDPTTCERDYAPAELEFMQAMQKYKQWSGRMFPTWSEVLEVLQGLGYEKATGGGAVSGSRFAHSQEVTS
jgi:hypothetical protein